MYAVKKNLSWYNSITWDELIVSIGMFDIYLHDFMMTTSIDRIICIDYQYLYHITVILLLQTVLFCAMGSFGLVIYMYTFFVYTEWI